jgi:hypothetical protein
MRILDRPVISCRGPIGCAVKARYHNGRTSQRRVLADGCLHGPRSDRSRGHCMSRISPTCRHRVVTPSQEEVVRREYEHIWSLLGGRTIEDLIDLPLMEDAASLATVAVLGKFVPPAYFTDANLGAWTTYTCAHRSVLARVARRGRSRVGRIEIRPGSRQNAVRQTCQA